MAYIAYVLMIIAMGVTLVILGFGLVSLAKGGEFAQKWSNKLMRYRIMAQACAIVFFIIGYLLLTAGQ